ncbi:MAG: isochorismate synthase [bacterium]|nr:isochorismate synthase [bacterium]
MPPLGKQLEQVELRQVVSQMTAMILSEVSDPASTTLLRLELPIPETDPLNWLTFQSLGPKTYWAERDQSTRTAGLGASDIFGANDQVEYESVFQYVSARLGDNIKQGRYFGGFSFLPGSHHSNGWELFGACRFVLPRFEIISDGSGCRFICNLIPERDSAQIDRILSELEQISFESLPQPPVRLQIVSQVDNPDQQGWEETVDLALKEFESSRLNKIVLARQSCLELSGTVTAPQVMKQLSSRATDCFHFLFESIDSRAAFLGASPELLYHRRGRCIETEAVAGTRSRGSDPSDDLRLGKKLLNSEKELREQAIVASDILDSLQNLADEINQTELGLLKLSKVQHLVRRFKAVLKDSVLDAEILRAIHPTPAVGGAPTRAALDKIAQLESFDRGWYAGPVGWVSHDQALFAVAIRSGLLSGKDLCLYSGAGIVEGSRAEAEWKELNKKLLNFAESISDYEI